jgi:hypothetical protein
VWGKGVPGTLKSEEGEGVGCWDLRAGNRGMQVLLMPKGQKRTCEVGLDRGGLEAARDEVYRIPVIW